MESSIYIIIFFSSLLFVFILLPIFNYANKRYLYTTIVLSFLILFFGINYSQVSNYNWKANIEVENIQTILKEIDEYLLENPKDIKALKLAGSAYVKMEVYDKAFIYFKNAYTLSTEDDFIILLGLIESGLMSQSTEFPQDIETLINKALFLEPLNPQALWYGGLIAMSKGNTTLAIERLSQLSENEDISIEMQNSINTQLEQLKIMGQVFKE